MFHQLSSCWDVSDTEPAFSLQCFLHSWPKETKFVKAMNKNRQPKPICCHTDIRFAFTLHEQWKVHSLKLEVKKKKSKIISPRRCFIFFITKQLTTAELSLLSKTSQLTWHKPDQHHSHAVQYKIMLQVWLRMQQLTYWLPNSAVVPQASRIASPKHTREHEGRFPAAQRVAGIREKQTALNGAPLLLQSWARLLQHSAEALWGDSWLSVNTREATSSSLKISLSIPLNFFVLKAWKTANTKPTQVCLCRKGLVITTVQLNCTWRELLVTSKAGTKAKINWVRSVKALWPHPVSPGSKGWDVLQWEMMLLLILQFYR